MKSRLLDDKAIIAKSYFLINNGKRIAHYFLLVKMPNRIKNQAQERIWRQKAKALQKDIMSLWIRAKKLRKAKK
mgnify:CR=1 FL=1